MITRYGIPTVHFCSVFLFIFDSHALFLMLPRQQMILSDTCFTLYYMMD